MNEDNIRTRLDEIIRNTCILKGRKPYCFYLNTEEVELLKAEIADIAGDSSFLFREKPLEYDGVLIRIKE